jgi:hypothetical protein
VSIFADAAAPKILGAGTQEAQHHGAKAPLGVA